MWVNCAATSPRCKALFLPRKVTFSNIRIPQRTHTHTTRTRTVGSSGPLNTQRRHLRGGLSHTHITHTATHGWWRSFIGSSTRRRAGSIRCPSPESRVTKGCIIAERCAPVTTTTTTILAAASSRKARGGGPGRNRKGTQIRGLALTIGDDPGSTRLSRPPAASRCYLEHAVCAHVRMNAVVRSVHGGWYPAAACSVYAAHTQGACRSSKCVGWGRDAVG